MHALLISTYELGRQPFGLASPAAWLRREGMEVDCVDAAKEQLSADVARRADLVAFHLPMHTATRLAGPDHSTACGTLNPAARMCAYGLYAPLNAEWLRGLGITDILGGEFEEDLAAIARAVLTAHRPPVPMTAARQPGDSTPAVSRARSIGPSHARSLRDASIGRRHPQDRGLHRGKPRLPPSVPSLPGCADLPGAVPRRPARRRARRHRRSGRGRRPAHHVWRS